MPENYNFAENSRDSLASAILKIDQVIEHPIEDSIKVDLINEGLDLIEKAHSELIHLKNQISREGWLNERWR